MKIALLSFSNNIDEIDQQLVVVLELVRDKDSRSVRNKDGFGVKGWGEKRRERPSHMAERLVTR